MISRLAPSPSSARAVLLAGFKFSPATVVVKPALKRPSFLIFSIKIEAALFA